MMDVLQLKEMTNRAEQLREKIVDNFCKLDLSTDNIPVNMQPKDGPIKLVFAGQYSAGKSSIIQMISGIKTEIGAAITTQKASVYPWGDLEIIDTPGIETGLRKDHDDITYAEIDKAALLVFVVTNEGFDNHMGEHFRKLAIDQHRGDHMILVINKMDRAPKGNSKEQQDLLREDMNKVIQPYTHEQLYTSFISTELYNEAMEETDEELKNDLLIESGYNELIKNINAFVKEKGVTAKLAQPLYALSDCLKCTEVDENTFKILDKQEELLKRTKRVYDVEKADALEAIQNETMRMQSDILNIGTQLANNIVGTGMSKQEAKQEMDNAAKNASTIVNNCAARVENILVTMVKNAELNLDEIEHSNLAMDVMQTNLPQILGKDKSNTNDYGDKLYKVGNLMFNYAAKEDVKGVFGDGLKSFSGTGFHQDILKFGKKLGVKFKPWQAVKVTQKAAMFGKVLEGIGVLYQIYQFNRSKEEEDKYQKEMDDARSAIKMQFQEWASKAYGEIFGSAREQVALLMDKPQEKLENDLALIAETREKMEAIEPMVKDLQDDVFVLLNELEDCRE
ncbi:GTPase [Selenomonas ruminantium]|uniref:GTPase n=1 Tax=Selenomonas ruminantium TaxID=971 RepID=UPI0026F2718C|nr:GTPase [Selenomonas ruminantium]